MKFKKRLKLPFNEDYLKGKKHGYNSRTDENQASITLYDR